MSENLREHHTESAPKSTRVVTYVVLGAIFVILLAIGIGTFHAAKTSTEATKKAAQLQDAFRTAGLPVPSEDQITRVLGVDGGSMCRNPVNALRQAQLQASMTNGAAGPGLRPVISDPLIVQGELRAIGIYCPDRLAEFTNHIRDNYDLQEGVAQ